MRCFKKFFQNEDGAVSMEYALIGGMISILIITGVSSIGTTVNSMFFGPIGAALGSASP